MHCEDREWKKRADIRFRMERLIDTVSSKQFDNHSEKDKHGQLVGDKKTQ